DVVDDGMAGDNQLNGIAVILTTVMDGYGYGYLSDGSTVNIPAYAGAGAGNRTGCGTPVNAGRGHISGHRESSTPLGTAGMVGGFACGQASDADRNNHDLAGHAADDLTVITFTVVGQSRDNVLIGRADRETGVNEALLKREVCGVDLDKGLTRSLRTAVDTV